MLTPLDIHNKDFKHGFRGYAETEVDEFLDEVVRDFETLLKDNAGLKAQVEELRQKVEQYHQMEETLKNALVVAQETANEVKVNARKEAELIVREAQTEAERRRHAAESAVLQAGEKLAAAERHATEFRARVRSLLEGQIEVLKRDDNWRVSAQSVDGQNDPGARRIVPAAATGSDGTGGDEAATAQEVVPAGQDEDGAPSES